MTSNPQSSGHQFRPLIPPQQVHPFMPPVSHQFIHVGQGMVGSNVAPPPTHFPHPSMHLPPGLGPSVQGLPSSQAMPMQYMQATRPITSTSLQPLQNAPVSDNHLPNINGAGMTLSSSYTFTTSYAQPPNSINASSQYAQASQMYTSVTPAGEQPWSTSETQSARLGAPLVQSAQTSASNSTGQPGPMGIASSDWQEHTAADGKRYYYNKKIRQSSWEKPIELMTPLERADASTGWKEFTTAEGRKYFYNKVTKQSKWNIPDELKLAREQAEKAGTQPTAMEPVVTSLGPPANASVDTPISADNTSGQVPTVGSTIEASPFPATVNSTVALGSPSITAPLVTAPASDNSPSTPVITGVYSLGMDSSTAMNIEKNSSSPNTMVVVNGTSAQDLEEAKRGMAVAGKVNITPIEEKGIDEETPVFANKLEAKNAFKSLLESANVESDWTWEQAMRVIINDKRYGALKSLGERKQTFNEYLSQRKKQEAEERRTKQKKAREDFFKMLEECKELTSSSRWSKVVTMLEGDERFSVVERPRDREDLFETYIAELHKKERAKAAEEHKRNVAEYRAFLESCDFIKANSQWRKVQDRLEDDERCSRLEKFERLELFQEYIHDLEKEEEEQNRIQKEQLRKIERKNRDAFRKLLEEDVAAGLLTAKTNWRDYCMKVKDSPAFLAVSSNTSGSTPKALFGDVSEELEKQYCDDKTQVKAAVKNRKIALTSTSTFESFSHAVINDSNMKRISEINLKLIFDELVEKLRGKEEKEAKERQRRADSFATMLHSMKDITATTKWEEILSHFEDNQDFRSIGEENVAKQIFEEHVARLLEKAKEKERRREEEKAKKEKVREEKERRKEKDRRDKGREHGKEKGKKRSEKDEIDIENIDVLESHSGKDRKREKDKDKKHRRRHHSTEGNENLEKDEREEPKKSRRYNSDRRKSRKHGHATDSDSENRHKRHRKERDGSNRDVAYEELEDGELGEDVELH